MTEQSFLRTHRRSIIIWIGILILIIIALILGIDQKIILFFTLLLGLFTQVFSGLGALIAAIPLVGPILIKVLTIPFFWILNGLGYFVSIIAIRRGYTKEVVSSRVLTIALLVGITIGYILGQIVPLK
jgi:hypothetical protein